MLSCRYENFRCPSSLVARRSSDVRIENYFFNYWTDSAEIWHTCVNLKVSSVTKVWCFLRFVWRLARAPIGARSWKICVPMDEMLRNFAQRLD